MGILDLYSDETLILYYSQIVILFIFLVLVFIIKNKFKIYSIFRTRKLFEIYLISISSSFLGTTLGLFIGLSNTPVVGVFVPALLTFISGIITYFYVTKKDEFVYENRIIVSINLILISFFLVVGAAKGSEKRLKIELEMQYRDYIYKIEEKEFDLKMKVVYEKSKKDTSEFETVKKINFEEVKDILKKNK